MSSVCGSIELSDLSNDSMPITFLSRRSRNILSRYLNPNLRGKDWRDVADLLEYDYLTILNWERKDDPMGEVLRDWSTKRNSSVAKLKEVLVDLERDDILADIERSLERDIKQWKERVEREALEADTPVQVNEVTGSAQNYPNLPETDELRGITLRDHPTGPPETFDAYVCFCEEDRHIVMKMMSMLEKPPYGLKLCIDFRDLVPGTAYVTATAELITNRCKRIIIVLSPEFLVSEQCDFQAKIALTFSPGARMKRIVPMLYKRCEVPNILRHITICDYTKSDLQEWFWDRVYAALNLR
ncbi:myeloid differentiation primary response protein MyD88-like [Glandiceps talaboti]